LTNSINSVLAAAASSAPAASLPAEQLNQADFLKLMIAQLKDQDPTSPMDATQFVGQLARFSQIAATQKMQSSFSQLAAALSANQVLNASSLIGKRVVVPSSSITSTANGADGAVKVPAAVSDVRVTISDAAGKPVRVIDLGPQAAGMVHFQWNGLATDGKPAAPGPYILAASDGNNPLTTYVDGLVTGVGKQGGNTSVQVQGVGDVALTQVAQVI
jgi:flagellar basal-body rod modification protein FlgD